MAMTLRHTSLLPVLAAEHAGLIFIPSALASIGAKQVSPAQRLEHQESDELQVTIQQGDRRRSLDTLSTEQCGADRQTTECTSSYPSLRLQQPVISHHQPPSPPQTTILSTTKTIETVIIGDACTALNQANHLASKHVLDAFEAQTPSNKRRRIDYVNKKSQLQRELTRRLDELDGSGEPFCEELDACEDVVVLGRADEGEGVRTVTSVAVKVWVTQRVLRAPRNI